MYIDQGSHNLEIHVDVDQTFSQGVIHLRMRVYTGSRDTHIECVQGLCDGHVGGAKSGTGTGAIPVSCSEMVTHTSKAHSQTF